jgi:hypothetical protein
VPATPLPPEELLPQPAAATAMVTTIADTISRLAFMIDSSVSFELLNWIKGTKMVLYCNRH